MICGRQARGALLAMAPDIVACAYATLLLGIGQHCPVNVGFRLVMAPVIVARVFNAMFVVRYAGYSDNCSVRVHLLAVLAAFAFIPCTQFKLVFASAHVRLPWLARPPNYIRLYSSSPHQPRLPPLMSK